jgi:hypothetical protein
MFPFSAKVVFTDIQRVDGLVTGVVFKDLSPLHKLMEIMRETRERLESNLPFTISNLLAEESLIVEGNRVHIKSFISKASAGR